MAIYKLSTKGISGGGSSFDIISLTEKSSPGASDYLAVYDGFGHKKISNAKFKQEIINSQTGTSYTLVATDAGKTVSMNNASINTLTIPANSSVAFPINTVINVVRLGDGKTYISGASGVTINGYSSFYLDKYSTVKLTKIDTDAWLVTGSIGGYVGWTENNSVLSSLNDYIVFASNFRNPTNSKDINEISYAGVDSPHALTIYDGAYLSQTEYKYGGVSLYTDGVDDYIQTPESDDWNLGRPFAVCGWFYPKYFSGHVVVIGNGGDGRHAYSAGWNIEILGNGGTMRFFYRDDSTQGFACGFGHSFSTNNWHHFIFNCDPSGNLAGYINGNQIGSTIQNFPAISNSVAPPLRISRSFESNNETCFNAFFDGIYIIKGASLTTNQISALYNSGAGSFLIR